MSIPQPRKDEQGKVIGDFYPLQRAELIALRKSKLINNAAYVHLALRYENPYCDRPIEIFPKEFAMRWQMPESSVYEAIGKLKDEKVIDIRYGKVIIQWTNSQQDESIDLQQEYVSGNSESAQPTRIDSEFSERSLNSQKKLRKSRKNSGIPENRPPEPLPQADSKTLQTIQTYSDLNQTLSEGKIGFAKFWAELAEEERERFENYCKTITANYQKPVIRITDWLASQDAAGQNRWESLYKEFKATEAATTLELDQKTKVEEEEALAKRKAADEFLARTQDPDIDQQCVPAPQNSAAKTQEAAQKEEISNQQEEGFKEPKTAGKGFGADRSLIQKLAAKSAQRNQKVKKPRFTINEQELDNARCNDEATPPHD